MVHISVSVLLLLTFYASIISCTSSNSAEEYAELITKASNTREPHCHEISPDEVMSSLETWHDDLAIVFYAPWCKYCKQMLVAWEAIATVLDPHSETVFGKFDCEASIENERVCQYIGIYQYPSILFIGFGNFHQPRPPSAPSSVPVKLFPNVVRFTSDLYFEALYDWVKMLSFMSRKKRKWDEFKGFFSGRSYLHTRYFKSILDASNTVPVSSS